MQASGLFSGAGGGLIIGALKFIPLIGTIIGVIGSLFSIFGGGPDLSKITQAINTLADQTAKGLDAGKRFTWASGRMALGGLLLVWRVIDGMISELVKAFRSILAALDKLYNDVIKPALRGLRAIRKILDDVYNKWLRPIINVIQQVRRILAIFRAFGFKWAGALDARLAKIEGRIIGPFLWVIRQMNGYGRWINVILTAGGLIQKPIFRNSAYANAGYLANLWWITQTSGYPGSPALVSPPHAAPASLADVQSQFQQYAQTDTGPLAAAAAAALQAAQQTNIGA